MAFIKTILPLVLVWLISSPLDAAPTLNLTYAGDSAKPVAGVKITQTESDETVTVYASNSNGEVTLNTTASTYTLATSLAETGDDPVDLLDAIWILQHSGELRTLTPDQLKAADVSGDGEVDLLDAIYILQHSGELRTLSPSLIFLDTNTGNPLSETTFSPGDTPSVTVVRTGDVDQGFDPTAITDHAPILTGKTTLTMDENQTSVSTLLGTDADGDTLTYSITGGVDKDLFAINASTGALSFKAGPDYELPNDSGENNSYEVEISVNDGTNTTSQALVVNVTDLNDRGPVISSSATFSAAENQTAVGTVTATDADGDSLTYTLSGTDASSFSISSSGVITFDSAPDYETKASYSVTVNVSDGVNTTTQALTIAVTNVNDISPVISSSATFSAAENQTAVGTVTATDAEDDSLTYTLSGTDASSFGISSSGVITFDSAPDYETKTSYSITVNVSDGVNTTTQALTIAVTNVNDAWVQRGSDIDGEAEDDHMGYGISLSNDKDTFIAGTPLNDGNGTSSGHARIFDWNGSAWVQRGSDIDGEAAGDSNGYSSSMSSDGDTVAIGAYQNDGNGGQAGHARIFDWNGSAWVQRGSDIDGEASPNFSGYSVSISSDGDTVAIGAPYNDGNSPDQNYNSGHARVFDWNGSAWVQRGSDIDGEEAGDFSGRAVSISSDGDTVAISAPDNDGNGTSSGHARIFDWNGSAWVQRGSDIDGEAAGDVSGYPNGTLSISNDGDTVAIGAIYNDGNGEDAGHARIFDWNGSAWVQRGSDIDGEAAGDWFGIHVSMSDDGDTVAIGAYKNDGNGEDAGHARVFDWNGSAWVQRGSDIDGEAAGDLGSIVSISSDGETLAVGARSNDGNGTDSGHVRVFDWN